MILCPCVAAAIAIAFGVQLLSSKKQRIRKSAAPAAVEQKADNAKAFLRSQRRR